MARIRTIKPEFFTSEDIVSMSPLARLFYVSLWCEADREGRLEWKPGTFKIRYLPGDQCDVTELAQELQDRDLIAIYEVDGKKYAEIPKFTTHQVINNREASSTLPARELDAKTTRAPRVKVTRPRVSVEGKEGKEHASSTRVDPPEGVSPEIWRDFLKLRQAKKAPLTETALDGIRREAEKAGMSLAAALETCCKRGWQGFEAAWVNGRQQSFGGEEARGQGI